MPDLADDRSLMSTFDSNSNLWAFAKCSVHALMRKKHLIIPTICSADITSRYGCILVDCYKQEAQLLLG